MKLCLFLFRIMNKVLLHSCCAPCSAAILEWMVQNGYAPTILFFNPNIWPEEEYLKRKGEIVRYAGEIEVEIADLDGSIEDSACSNKKAADAMEQDAKYGACALRAIQRHQVQDICKSAEWSDAHLLWRAEVEHLADEPERGARCLECFKYRLAEAARYASMHGFDTFTTTLASSRWKDINQVFEAGRYAASLYPGVTFWDKNWRKGGLYERRNLLAKQFYNQNYCGCEFSLRNR